MTIDPPVEDPAVEEEAGGSRSRRHYGPPASLFVRDGQDVFVPTDAAVGPWSPDALHGGAVAALLAGLVDDSERVVVRFVVDLLAPVPCVPLRAEVGAPEGGSRVSRQTVVLSVEGRPVARAHALRMSEVPPTELPARAVARPVAFDPAAVPPLDTPNRRAAETVGRESFDSLAMASVQAPLPPGASASVRLWLRLLLPVVDGHRPSPLEQVAAAADFSAGGTHRRLGFRSWSFVNADLVVSLARRPAGDWVGLECDGLVGPSGTGQSIASVHDSNGRLGQASQSILVRPRG